MVLDATGDGYYAILNRASRRCVDVRDGSSADAARIQQWDYLQGTNQQWRLVFTDPAHVALVNRLSGKVLDDTGYSVSNGTPIQQWSYAGASNQQWQLTPITFFTTW